MSKKTSKLTPKQEMFVKEYLIDLNATQAAIRAGYSKKTAKDIACENLAKPNIAKAIQEAFNKRAERIEVDQDYVLNTFIEVIQRGLQKKKVMVYDPKEKQMVQLVDENDKSVWQFDGTNVNRAAENLGKHLGILDGKFAGKKILFPTGVAFVLDNGPDDNNSEQSGEMGAEVQSPPETS